MPWVWLLILIVVPVAVMASWVGTEFLIKQSSGVAFCTTCHTMDPMGKAYLTSKHGGNSHLGIRVECADCHLPHDSVTNYLLTKASTGIRDMWAQFTHDPEKTDWQAKRANRHHYVFDSGCLKCHSEIARDNKSTHPAYFAGGDNPFRGEDKFRCVNCHFYVGHSDASKWLEVSNNK